MNASGHLTENELDDVLIGVASPEAESHLASCGLCAARQVEFTAAIGNFNQATLAWSQAKSHTLTRDLTAGASAPTSRLGHAATGLCAVTLTAAVLVATLPGHQDSAPPQANAVHADRDGEIATDDAMLRAIDDALYRPDPSPEQVYRLSAPAGGHRRGTSSEASE